MVSLNCPRKTCRQRGRRTGKFGFERLFEESKLGLLKGFEDICRGDCLLASIHGVLIGTGLWSTMVSQVIELLPGKTYCEAR
jgi:hypothetical protein